MRKKKEDILSKKSDIDSYLTRMIALNPDSVTFESDSLKKVENRLNETEKVFLFGVELKYPKLFTCLSGHELEYLLNKIFGSDIKCEKMIKVFADIGIFVPNELVRIFKNVGQNIIQLSDSAFYRLVRDKKARYKKYAWFIRYKSDQTEDDGEFER